MATATGSPIKLDTVLGFALLWAVGKGCVNQNAFAYPQDGAGVSPTFALYLLVTTATAALFLTNARIRLASPRHAPVYAAVGISLGFTLLISFPQAPHGYIGSVIAGFGLAWLNVLYLRKFMRSDITESPVPLIAAIVIGDLLTAIFSLPLPIQLKTYLFCGCPFIAAALANTSEPYRTKPATRTRHDSVTTPLLGFAAFTLVSISVSHLFMTQGPLSSAANTLAHIAAPLVGVLVFWALSAARLHNAPLVAPIFLITAFAFLPVPFLGDWYLGPVKVLTLMASEVLFLSTAVACAEATAEYEIDDLTLPAAIFMLLNGFTFLGTLVGTACASLGNAFATAPYLIIEAVSFLLLLTTTLLIMAAERTRRADAALLVETSEPISAKEVSANAAEQFCLTPREREILSHLLLHEAPQQIAKELFLSPDTVRGHMKNIYRKAGVHSRQELVQMIQEAQVDSLSTHKFPA